MNMFRASHKMILVLAAALLLGGVPSAASAADCDLSSPTADQYCPPSTITGGGGLEPGAGPGGLPFTGYDAGLAALVALGFIGAGIRLSRAVKAARSA